MNLEAIQAILKGDLDAFRVDLDLECDPCVADPTSPACLLKARPVTEGDRRFIYCEPSNENWDSEGERVLQKALAASKDFFLKWGNLDLNHLTLFGWKMGLDNPDQYEIGKPVEVKVSPRVLVKGEIYRGAGQAVEKANWFWSTLTEQNPPRDWYPSVAGIKPARKEAGDGRQVVHGVQWTNLAFAKIPVNKTVSPVSVMPLPEFAKAVTAGYGTDAATLTGGAALRRQSGFRAAPASRYLQAVGLGTCEHTAGKPTLAKMVAHFRDCEGLDEVSARSHAEHVIADAAKRWRAGSSTQPLREAA